MCGIAHPVAEKKIARRKRFVFPDQDRNFLHGN